MKKLNVNDLTLKCGYETDYVEMMKIADAGFTTVRQLYEKGVSYKELEAYSKRENKKSYVSILDSNPKLKEEYLEAKRRENAKGDLADFVAMSLPEILEYFSPEFFLKIMADEVYEVVHKANAS